MQKIKKLFILPAVAFVTLPVFSSSAWANEAVGTVSIEGSATYSSGQVQALGEGGTVCGNVVVSKTGSEPSKVELKFNTEQCKALDNAGIGPYYSVVTYSGGTSLGWPLKFDKNNTNPCTFQVIFKQTNQPTQNVEFINSPNSSCRFNGI